MSFLIKDDEAWDKYDKIQDATKDKLGIKFHSEPVYEFDGAIKANFLGNDMAKENMHYTCIACITIDYVMRMDKKAICRFIQRNANIEKKHRCLDS